MNNFYNSFFLFFFKDITNTKDYDKLVQIVSEKVGKAGLNVLYNNAGISTKFTRLGLVKEEQLIKQFYVNTIAPIMLTKVSVKFILSIIFIFKRYNILKSKYLYILFKKLIVYHLYSS